MKINFKSLTIGVIIGISLTVGTFTFAENRQVTALIDNIKIMVNGVTVDTKDTPPMIIDNRTYVPARYVAEALGATVSWNESANTVEVNSEVTKSTPNNTMNTINTPETQPVNKPNNRRDYIYEGVLYSDTTNLPVGAEWVEVSGVKCIKWNNKIFMHCEDVVKVYNLNWSTDYNANKITFTNKINGKSVIVDYSDNQNGNSIIIYDIIAYIDISLLKEVE